jgi:hypothetical protein
MARGSARSAPAERCERFMSVMEKPTGAWCR